LSIYLLTDFHVICRTQEFDAPHGKSPVHSAEECFSKKIENHKHRMAIYTMNYNFCWINQTLRVTPAMKAKLTYHVWSLEEIVGLLS
jgi:hypothetical protein